ncbi:MAG: ribonuclease H-like domain-containing protein [Nanoarchaeota archaeon]|nr:ribonuclease H-like domain-containing protein [Nanoarchaeota archaeon]
MIEKSFVFLDRIGFKGEERIIREVKDWNGFLKADKVKGISRKAKLFFNRKIKDAQRELHSENADYFVGKLPKKEMWRLYNWFKDSVLFLDIEIDSYGEVIIIGMSDGYDSKLMVKGVNMDKDIFVNELSKYKLLITFNGRSFDIPKIEKTFGIKVDKAHIDLKPLCVNLGWKGGLKEVENILGIERPPHLRGNPVDLWRAFHASGDEEYLDLLIAYNEEDVVNLKAVVERVYSELIF